MSYTYFKPMKTDDTYYYPSITFSLGKNYFIDSQNFSHIQLASSICKKQNTLEILSDLSKDP